MGSMRSLVTFCFAMSLLVSSCSLFKGLRPEKPEVSLQSVSVAKMSWTKVDMVFELDVQNPNDFEIEIESLSYRLNTLGKRLGEGSYNETIILPKKASKSVKIPFSLRPEMTLEVAKRFLNKEEKLLVQLQATVEVASMFGSLSYDFEEEKNILEMNLN